MTGPSRQHEDLWHPAVARRVDQKCLAFELAWHDALSGGPAPRLEVYLADVAEPGRSILLGELLALEWAYRKKQGTLSSLADYRQRFPTDGSLLERLWAQEIPTVAGPPPQLVETIAYGPPEESNQAGTPATSAAAELRVSLKVTAGPHKGRVFTFVGHDMFLVGRSKRAHFRLSGADRYVSRIHFMVEVNPPLCRLVDMGSRNGTLVNGRKVAGRTSRMATRFASATRSCGSRLTLPMQPNWHRRTGFPSRTARAARNRVRNQPGRSLRRHGQPASRPGRVRPVGPRRLPGPRSAATKKDGPCCRFARPACRRFVRSRS